MLVDKERTSKLTKIILDHYGLVFHGKKVLDLGGGSGDIANAFARQGATITCVDARQNNLDEINKKYPFIKTMRVDLEHEWPFDGQQFDYVIVLGVLEHLKNFEKLLENITCVAENIVLETEVLDSKDENLRVPIYEEKSIDYLAMSGEGSVVSSANIQRRLSNMCATFKRCDETRINYGDFRYDWREQGIGRKWGNRRLWFIRRDKFWKGKNVAVPQIAIHHGEAIDNTQAGVLARAQSETALMPQEPHKAVVGQEMASPSHSQPIAHTNNEKIAVILKIRKRGNDIDCVLKNLNFWLAIFSSNKYEVLIYSEDIDLSEEYHRNFKVIRKQDLLNNQECRRFHQKTDSNFVSPNWKNACKAIGSIYYLVNNKYCWNIDADDMLIVPGPVKKYFRQIEELFETDKSLITMSYDLHYSSHVGEYINDRAHHWSFGINFSRREEFKALIDKAMDIRIPVMKWGINIDYMVDVALEQMPELKYIAFTTPSLFLHCWADNYVEAKTTKFNKTSGQIDSRLINIHKSHPAHKRTLVLE